MGYKVRVKIEVIMLVVRFIGMMLCFRFGEIRKMVSTWIVVWVKIGVSWAGLFFYLWTLVVFFFLFNRDFS